MTAAGRTGKAKAAPLGLQSAGGTAAGLAIAEPEIAVATAAADALQHGSVVIAAITSCTNTSNPSVMVAAGLLAKKAVEKGLSSKPWVKTSLAPGSKVVTEYFDEAGLTAYLDQLGFNLVGYGCTTCIGNSGPLPAAISKAIEERDLVAVAVLSGNRNFEGRINSDVRANYLASPPLVVAYALAGRIDVDFQTEPLGTGKDGQPVYLRDVWPSRKEVEETILRAVRSEMFREQYRDVFDGDESWNSLDVPEGDPYAWDPASTYVRQPPYFVDMPAEPAPVEDVHGARVLALLGDSITTDHISPAGSIKAAGPAGKYLVEHGVAPKDFNSYGARRGNHEVMMRGTFANIRIRNRMVPGIEGGFTLPPAGRRAAVDLRRGDEVQGRGDSHGRPRRQGVRHRLLARLGRQGPAAPGGPRRHRRELRAHPPQQPRRHGHRAAGVPGRRERRHPRPHRPRGDRHRRPRRRGRERLQGRPRDDRPGAEGGRQRRPPSKRGSASTRRRRSSTTATAASCTTCCGSFCVHKKSPAPGRDPARGEERELRDCWSDWLQDGSNSRTPSHLL